MTHTKTKNENKYCTSELQMSQELRRSNNRI